MSTLDPLFRLSAVSETEENRFLRIDPGDSADDVSAAENPPALREDDPAMGGRTVPRIFRAHTDNLIHQLSEWSLRLDAREADLDHRRSLLHVESRHQRFVGGISPKAVS